MGWQKGQSGNPGGRPVKSRALTAILERAGHKTLIVNDKRITRRKLIAEMLWELVTTGKVVLPNGATWVVDPKDWLETAKWVYSQIDGAPKQALEVSGAGGGAIAHKVTFDYDDYARLFGAVEEADDKGKT